MAREFTAEDTITSLKDYSLHRLVMHSHTTYFTRYFCCEFTRILGNCSNYKFCMDCMAHELDKLRNYFD